MMHQLSKKEPSRHAIIGTQNVVASIVHVMGNTNDPDVQRNISGALYHLSKDRYNSCIPYTMVYWNTQLDLRKAIKYSHACFSVFDISFIVAYSNSNVYL